MAEPADPPLPERRHSPPVPPPVVEAREMAIARLTESFARDELSLADFEGRVASAYDATSIAALTALVTDLPAARAAPALGPLRLEAVLSNLVRGGRLALPTRVEIHSFLGNVELDWRAAELQPGVTEVALRNFLGNVEIKLPPHVYVEYQGKAFMGSFECREPAARPAPGLEAPTIVRFTGRSTMGSVTVYLE